MYGSPETSHDEEHDLAPLLPIKDERDGDAPPVLQRRSTSRIRTLLACLLALIVVLAALEATKSTTIREYAKNTLEGAMGSPKEVEQNVEIVDPPELNVIDVSKTSLEVLPTEVLEALEPTTRNDAAELEPTTQIEAIQAVEVNPTEATLLEATTTTSIPVPAPTLAPITIYPAILQPPMLPPSDLVKLPLPPTPLNINPRPFPIPLGAESDPKPRYLAYENHSGFHNQRISLQNALVLAKMLNRTLLLPPARLGKAEAWSPHAQRYISEDEECKRRQMGKAEFSQCRNIDTWTYIGWPYIFRHDLFDGRSLVDRWNSSMAWFEAPKEEGGLGITPGSMVNLEPTDKVRKAYQLWDDDTDGTEPISGFDSRINIDDLKVGKFADAELLHFGSLFYSSRLVLRKPESKLLERDAGRRMILGNSLIDQLSDGAKAKLGRYRGVHLRVGDGPFKQNSKRNMRIVFTALFKELKMPLELVENYLPPAEPERVKRSMADSDADDVENIPSNLVPRFVADAPPLSRDLSPSLKCSAPLYTDPELLPLNTVLYVATDSRSPRSDPVLAPFFKAFPCIFTLSEFHAALDAAEADWTSEWDGMHLKKFILPFLDAEIAAKGMSTLGTPSSTFSAYAQGILHSVYVAEGSITTRQRRHRRSFH